MSNNTQNILPANQPIALGQRVYTSLYSRGPGIVVRIHGEQSPESCGSIAGVMVTGGRAHFDIAFRDGCASKHLPESVLRGIQWKVYDDVADADEILDAIAHSESEAKRKAEEKAAADAQRAIDYDRHVAELRAKYPWATDKGSDHARASKHMKRELREAFPGVKFSVRSDSYSMGDSVDVTWTNGPTSEQVKTITRKYQQGSFNSMEDIYEDDKSAFSDAVGTVLGQSKHVFEKRGYDDRLCEAAARAWCDHKQLEFHGMNGYVEFRGGNESLHMVAYNLLRPVVIPAGAKVVGIELVDHDFVVALESPAVDQPATTDDDPVPTDPAPTSATIQKHRHTKRGFDFWLIPTGRGLDSSTFDRLRDACNSAGGWYSRKWGTTPGGFAFKSEAKALEFAAEHFGTDGETETPAPPASDAGAVDTRDVDPGPTLRIHNPDSDDSATSRQSSNYAAATRTPAHNTDRLRAMADKLLADAKDKLRPRDTHTPKKLSQARSAERDGQQYQRAAAAIIAFCDAIDADDLPAVLADFKPLKTAFLRSVAMKGKPVSNGYHGYHVDSHEHVDESAHAVALRQLVESGKSDDDRAADLAAVRDRELSQKVDKLRNSKIDGFFPTPRGLIDRMLDAADLQPGQSIVDPSCGKGDILNAVRDRFPISDDGLSSPVNLTGVEINVDLADIASHTEAVQCDDFLDTVGEYDRILMNPPYERRQAVKHVEHAWSQLRPGGRLVALMPITQVDDVSLPQLASFSSTKIENGFSGSDAFRKTGVTVAMIVATKIDPTAPPVEAIEIDERRAGYMSIIVNTPSGPVRVVIDADCEQLRVYSGGDVAPGATVNL